MISVSEEWKNKFPETCFGILVIEGAVNSANSADLEEKRQILEARLRREYNGKSRKDIAGLSPFSKYQKYFREFGQNYPVIHQLETIALKGNPVFSPSPLVTAMFMAELENGLLTAGHDLDRLAPPVVLGVASGNESYVTMGGKERILKKGDMFLSDQQGVLSSVLYGPDKRSRITEKTTRALFAVYGALSLPKSDIRFHLEGIEKLILMFSPESNRQELLIVP